MLFQVGETLVYPHHGAATIMKVETRAVKDVQMTYITLAVDSGKLTITIPIDKAEFIGVRDVIDAAGLEEVFAVLRSEAGEESTNWSRRFKANQEKMASGNVLSVTEVVRDLKRRDEDRGLSAGEKRLMLKARQILVSELALALHETSEAASSTLDNVLNTTVTV
jgi:CarD family transcriptional regulator